MKRDGSGEGTGLRQLRRSFVRCLSPEPCLPLWCPQRAEHLPVAQLVMALVSVASASLADMRLY